MPIDSAFLNTLQRQFTPPDLQELEQNRIQNQLGRLRVNQTQVAQAAMANPNSTPEQLARAGSPDIAKAVTGAQDDQLNRRAKASGFLGQAFEGISQLEPQQALVAASKLVQTPLFKEAATAAGLNPDSFTVQPNDSGDVIKQQSAGWAATLRGISDKLRSVKLDENGNAVEFMSDGSVRTAPGRYQQFAPQVKEIAGGKYVFNPTGGGSTQQLSTPEQEQANQAAVSNAKKGGELGAERTYDQPRALASMQSSQASLDRLAGTASEILNNQNLWKAVGLGKGLSKIPGSAGADVAALIKRLQSQAGFTVLQNLRDTSKSGGAVGQVSNYEEQLLQNNLASLGDTNQSPENFRNQVQEILNFVEGSKRRLQNAYDQTYAGPPQQGKSAPNVIRYDAQGNRIK